MRVSQETSNGLRHDCTDYNEARGEIVFVGIIRIPLPLKVNLRLLVQWKVNERVCYSQHARTQPIVQCEEAFALLDHPHGFEEVHRVFSSVVFFAHRAENLSLHTRTHHPERIRYTIADDTA